MTLKGDFSHPSHIVGDMENDALRITADAPRPSASDSPAFPSLRTKAPMTRRTRLREAHKKPGPRAAPQFRSAANSRRISSGTISRALWWVRVSQTRGAAWLRCASSHLAAQRHHRSPGLSPGNPNSGRGVDRSLPRSRENSRNSAVISAQTVCEPRSISPVLQQPSRKKPVSGSMPQSSRGSPKTLVDSLICSSITRLSLARISDSASQFGGCGSLMTLPDTSYSERKHRDRSRNHTHRDQ